MAPRTLDRRSPILANAWGPFFSHIHDMAVVIGVSPHRMSIALEEKGVSLRTTVISLYLSKMGHKKVRTPLLSKFDMGLLSQGVPAEAIAAHLQSRFCDSHQQGKGNRLLPLVEELLREIGLSKQCRDVDLIIERITFVSPETTPKLTKESWEKVLVNKPLSTYDLVVLAALLKLTNVTTEALSLEQMRDLQNAQIS